MTTLAIMATYEKKRLKCYGTVAAGEHVAVTITDGAQWIGEGTALRLRVLFGPDTVAVFPFADSDTWTAAGTQDADASCELNLNTLQAEKYLKHGGTCLWILDDVENHTLYATGEFEVLPWPKRRGIDEPIDLDGYPLLLDEIKDLKEAFEEYQRTVAQMLATKQDTIFDLATIRSGAAAGATAVQPPQIARFVDGAEYRQSYGEQNKPAILFKHGTNVIVALDATPFVRDGMVSDVEISGGNLVITFNTDSGKQPISIPLTDIFNPDNYYDKTAADGKFVAKEAGKGLSTEDYTTAEKTRLGGIEAGAQVNIIETIKVNGTALTPQDKAVDIPVPTIDNTVTPTSANGVKSSGIWSALWGALAALPTGFTSLYDWCVAQLAAKANDNAVVHLTGDQTIGGVKSFVDGVHIRLNRTDSDFQIEDPSGNLGTFTITNSMATGRWCFFARYWDNSICIASLPVNSGTLARIEDLAPDFSSSATYAVNALCIHESVLYRCTTAVTTAGDWTGSANWVTATVEDVLAALRTGKQDALSAQQLANIAAVPNKADVSAIPYALVTKTIDAGTVMLDDRAINAVAVSSSLASLTVNFPTATSGKARDFGLRLTVASGITTAPELALPQGVTCENADGAAPEIGADGAATILYFTETASGVFLVKGEVVTAIS